MIKVDQVAGLHHLEVVDFSFNFLIAIPVQINSLIKMQRFIVNNNQIRALPPTVCQLLALQELNLSTNLLSEIPNDIAALQLEHFHFHNNEKLTNPPKEIQEQG